MKLIAGLGNPGREYAQHRHNVGFRIVDEVAARARAELNQNKFDARCGQGQLGGEKIFLVQPQTFMNLSGKSVAAAARFYKVEPPDILVVHDEVDFPFGKLQLKSGGGSGGHNGLKSILECLGSDAFGRLRFGVGKPEGKERVVGHVLGGFSTEETSLLAELFGKAADAAECWATEGMPAAMNKHNRRVT